MNKVILIFTLMVSPIAFGWGNRGHHEICTAATYLVQDNELKNFLVFHQHRMGHLCNIPDIYWRDLPKQQTKLGNPTHYINASKMGKSPEKIPSDLSKLTKEQIKKLPKSGSAWWRAQQFYNLAISGAKKAAKAKAPNGGKQQQDRALPFNRGVFEMQSHMGIMGHFVADIMMPYHNHHDYDGKEAGNPGIHALYESVCVGRYDHELMNQILKRAMLIEKAPYLDSFKTVSERMKQATLISLKEKPLIEVIDKKVTRKNLNELCSKFKPLVIEQMSRAAKMLAVLWDEIYSKGGKPDVGKYRSYEYPFEPEFVAPDYL